MFYTYLNSPFESTDKEDRLEFSDMPGKNKVICDSSLEIGQNNHDIWILLNLEKFFQGGYIKPKYNYMDIEECKDSTSVNRYIFRNTSKIIDFVEKYPMLTAKQLDYLDWKRIVELKSDKSHKSLEGYIKIKEIISQVNSKRKY